MSRVKADIACRELGLDDDETLGANLVTGGLEEAAHDQMVEAAKEDQKQEG